MKKLLLLALLSAPAWADDVYIISPRENEAVGKNFTVQVQTPYGEPESVDAWITLDVEYGPDRVVWRGKLERKNNYSVTVNASKFAPGEYELDVRYFSGGRIFDGDTEFYVWPQATTPPPPPAQ